MLSVNVQPWKKTLVRGVTTDRRQRHQTDDTPTLVTSHKEGRDGEMESIIPSPPLQMSTQHRPRCLAKTPHNQWALITSTFTSFSLPLDKEEKTSQVQLALITLEKEQDVHLGGQAAFGEQ